MQQSQKKMTSTEAFEKKIRVRKLSPPFIKIGNKSRKYRPLVKEFNHWPCLQSIERKELVTLAVKNNANKLLFCEHCQESNIENLQLHLKTNKHKAIVSQT